VESFNGRLRVECLNTHWFLSLANARTKIEAWLRDHRESRPHTALGWLTPVEYTVSTAGKPGGCGPNSCWAGSETQGRSTPARAQQRDCKTSSRCRCHVTARNYAERVARIIEPASFLRMIAPISAKPKISSSHIAGSGTGEID